MTQRPIVLSNNPYRSRWRIHSHLHVHERPALGLGQKPMLKAARRRAMPFQLLELLATLDDPAVLQPSPSDPYHLSEWVADFEPLASDLDGNRPPLRICGRVADQRPDLIQWRINVNLSTVGRHLAILSEDHSLDTEPHCRLERKSWIQRMPALASTTAPRWALPGSNGRPP